MFIILGYPYHIPFKAGSRTERTKVEDGHLAVLGGSAGLGTNQFHKHSLADVATCVVPSFPQPRSSLGMRRDANVTLAFVLPQVPASNIHGWGWTPGNSRSRLLQHPKDAVDPADR